MSNLLMGLPWFFAYPLGAILAPLWLAVWLGLLVVTFFLQILPRAIIGLVIGMARGWDPASDYMARDLWIDKLIDYL